MAIKNFLLFFKGDQKDSNSFHPYHGDGHGKIFPKQHVVNKENSLKAGPWSQNGGKLRSRGLQPSSASKPTFQGRLMSRVISSVRQQ